MEFPKLTTASGVYTYYLALILAFALVIAVFILAVYLGVVPDLVSLSPT